MDRSMASEEAQRWLGTAEKLLAARDLLGAKSFAIRVREAFPRLETAANDVVAVADTLTAGETRIGNSGQQHRDWYAVLGLSRFTHNLDVVANHYRRLALILNPHRNRLPYADEAFRLVTESWSVLSNHSKKSFFDNELAVHSRYEFAAGAQSLTHPQAHLQEHQFLQRNNHQPQPQPQPQVQTQFHQQQHQHHIHQHQHQFFDQNPPPQLQFQPEPPQSHAHWQQQPQRPPQQQAQTATRTSPPNRNPAPTEDERPNLNNAAARLPEISPPPQPPSPPPPAPPSPEASAEREETPALEPERPEGPTFWTACPYCYILYEYPKLYEDCTLRCQTCKRAFTAGPIPAPPIGSASESGPTHFCCWGFFPLASSGKSEAGAAAGAGWSPFSPIFTTPVQDKSPPNTGRANTTSQKEKRNPEDSPRVVYKDDFEDSDDFMIEISDSDDDSDGDWRKSGGKKSKGASGSTKRKAKSSSNVRVTRARQIQTPAVKEKERPATRGVVLAAAAASGEMGRRSRRKGGAEWGRLDLNVEFNNDSDEPGKAVPNGAGNAGSGEEDDNIEGIGFFEGLDEFLSSLPILNVVGDEKVVKAA